MLAALLALGAALIGLAVPAAADGRGNAVACKDVLMKAPDGTVVAETFEMIAWQVRCKRARRIVRRTLIDPEASTTAGRLRCRVGPVGGTCRRRQAGVWWIHSAQTSISCAHPDAPYPCAHERPCGNVATQSEGARVSSRIFAHSVACERARKLVRRGARGRTPRPWQESGSGAGGFYYRSKAGRFVPWDTVRKRRHVRYSNVVALHDLPAQE